MTRKFVGKKKTYRVDDRTYKCFQNWCSDRGLDASTAIRGAISYLMKKGSVEEFLREPEILNIAKEIFSNNLKKE